MPKDFVITYLIVNCTCLFQAQTLTILLIDVGEKGVRRDEKNVEFCSKTFVNQKTLRRSYRGNKGSHIYSTVGFLQLLK